MKNKKKMLAVFTATTLAVGLTACGSGSGSESEANIGDSQKVEDNDEAVTLTVWCWDPNYNINALKVAEEIYQREHPNFSLEILERNSQEIMEKLATTTTSGTMDELPDIMLFDDSMVKQ